MYDDVHDDLQFTCDRQFTHDNLRMTIYSRRMTIYARRFTDNNLCTTTHDDLQMTI